MLHSLTREGGGGGVWDGVMLEENHVEEVKADLGLEAVEDDGDEEATEASEEKLENVRISSIMYYRK